MFDNYVYAFDNNKEMKNIILFTLNNSFNHIFLDYNYE